MYICIYIYIYIKPVEIKLQIIHIQNTYIILSENKSINLQIGSEEDCWVTPRDPYR